MPRRSWIRAEAGPGSFSSLAVVTSERGRPTAPSSGGSGSPEFASPTRRGDCRRARCRMISPPGPLERGNFPPAANRRVRRCRPRRPAVETGGGFPTAGTGRRARPRLICRPERPGPNGFMSVVRNSWRSNRDGCRPSGGGRQRPAPCLPLPSGRGALSARPKRTPPLALTRYVRRRGGQQNREAPRRR